MYMFTYSVVGLAKLLEYSVTSDYTRFDDILVRDEFIQKETGSQKQQGWTKIPVLLKAFKIIISELAYQTNSPEEGVQSEQTSVRISLLRLSLQYISIDSENYILFSFVNSRLNQTIIHTDFSMCLPVTVYIYYSEGILLNWFR